jgi:hypothetical protein
LRITHRRSHKPAPTDPIDLKSRKLLVVLDIIL